MNGDEGSWRSPEEHPGPEGGDPEGMEQPQERDGEGLVREGGGLTFRLGHRGLLVDLVRAVPVTEAIGARERETVRGEQSAAHTTPEKLSCDGESMESAPRAQRGKLRGRRMSPLGSRDGGGERRSLEGITSAASVSSDMEREVSRDRGRYWKFGLATEGNG